MTLIAVLAVTTASTPSYLSRALGPDNLPEWIQAIAALVAAIAVLFAWRQLKLMEDQIRQGTAQLVNAQAQLQSAVQWNKLNAVFTYFQSDVILSAEREATTALRTIGYDPLVIDTPLTSQDLDRIKADPVLHTKVKHLLNVLEDYSTAVNLGALDPDASFAMMENMIRRWHRLFQPLIEFTRNRLGDPLVYCELQKLAGRWNDQFAQEQATRVRRIGASQLV